MPKKVSAKQIVRKGKQVWRVLVPLALTGGKQQARFFKSKERAKAHAALLNGQRSSPIEEFQALSGIVQDYMMRALRAVDGDGKALELAAAEWAKTRMGKSDLLLGKFIKECLAEKLKDGLRPRSIKTMRGTFRSLETFLGSDKQVLAIGTPDISAWLNDQGWIGTTRNNRLMEIRTLFAYGIGQGWLVQNPGHGVKRPKRNATTIGILTPEDAERLMRAAQEVDKDLVPYIALCLFGGLRPEQEAPNVTWADVRNGHIRVGSENAKTRRHRDVEVNPTLRAWLDLGGDLPVVAVEKRIKRVRDAAGIGWSHDCMRHSYVSYGVRLWGATKVAAWAGHSEAMLYQHYRTLVDDEAAARFWGIMP